MSLRKVLPKPKNDYSDDDDDINISQAIKAVSAYMDELTEKNIPPYGERCDWQPKSLEDFGDGGAYPEIDVLQFPYNLGKKEIQKSNALPVTLDSEGNINYDALLRRNDSDKKKIIHYKFEDIIPMSMKNDEDIGDMVKPDDEEIRKITEETRNALELEVTNKITASLPTRIAKQIGAAEYIRYTPAQNGSEFNSGAKQRIIKMVEAQRDPLSPPRFKINGKVPVTPSSPPAPVMHSPPRKVTVQEQNDWKIPPCISSWKNPKGYVIPLDKRLATDGRGLQDTHINDKFAKLAEALYIADRKAREAVEMRSQMEKRVLQKEKEEQETKLHELAKKARMERDRIAENTQVDEDVAGRDGLRKERHRERERERRMTRAGAEKRSMLEKEKDRDISEKIALGMPSTNISHEAMFDQRLFNQTQGLDSGFQGGDDDIYNVYDGPWRKGENRSAMYRPSKNLETEIYGQDTENIIKTNRFANDKGLFGAEEATSSRQGPVQFEKHAGAIQEEDPFQLDEYLSEAKTGKKRKHENSNTDDNNQHKKRSK